MTQKQIRIFYLPTAHTRFSKHVINFLRWSDMPIQIQNITFQRTTLSPPSRVMRQNWAPAMTTNCHGKSYQKILSHSVTVINSKSQIIIKSSLLKRGYGTALSPYADTD